MKELFSMQNDRSMSLAQEHYLEKLAGTVWEELL